MVSYSELHEKGLSALQKAGVQPEFAEKQLSLLLDAELAGHVSHGLLRLPRVIERIQNGVCNPNTEGEHRWVNQAHLVVDGDQGLGPVVALSAIKKIVERVETTGVAVAAIRNANHLGMLAWYAQQVATNGKIVLGLSISEALVHPWGGREALLGTNPVAIGVPASPRPFVFDMATSEVSMGKIHDHANRNHAIPLGWALDRDGNPTVDPHAAKQGAIAPFGGAKGYALGLAFEVLVASLTASAIGRDVTGTLDSTNPCNKGDVFIVIEPASGSGPVISAFLEQIRNSAPADAANPVRVPGDRAAMTRETRTTEDIPLPPELWARIVELAR